MAYQTVVNVMTRTGTYEVRSPTYTSRSDAEGDITAIREKLESRADTNQMVAVLIDLPWLAVEAGNVGSAHIADASAR